MIQVFVHSAAPFLRCELAKKWMRISSALRFAALVKLPQLLFELFLFTNEIPRIGDHQLFVRWIVL